MHGLSPHKKQETSLDALDLAAALNEVLPLLQNPSEPLRQLVAEHKAMKETQIAHEKVLADNEKIYNDHKVSRAAFSEEQKKVTEHHAARDMEHAEREKEHLRQQNALAARESAVKKTEQTQKETATIHANKHTELVEWANKLAVRENALKAESDRIAAEKHEIKSKHEQLRAVIG